MPGADPASRLREVPVVDGPVVRAVNRSRRFLAVAVTVLLAAPSLAGAPAGDVRVRGALTAVAIDDRDDRFSVGAITVGTQRIVVPSHLLMNCRGRR